MTALTYLQLKETIIIKMGQKICKVSHQHNSNKKLTFVICLRVQLQLTKPSSYKRTFTPDSKDD